MDPETINITISAATLATLLGLARKVFRWEHRLGLVWNDYKERKGIDDDD